MDAATGGRVRGGPPAVQPGQASRPGNHPRGAHAGLPPRVATKRTRAVRHAGAAHDREETVSDLQWVLHRHARVRTLT